MRDFTFRVYLRLIELLKSRDYKFCSFMEFLESAPERCVVLRHDVDRKPVNSVIMAAIEHKFGIRGTYFFRAAPESWDEGAVRKIASMGHEIGYHYEDINTVAHRVKGSAKMMEKLLAEAGIESFRENLDRLRSVVPVRTICMHGSPMSRWDSRLLWKYYDYKDFGIEGEPYFDVNYDEVLYLTDTGRRWDGEKVNIRDKIPSTGLKNDFFRNKPRFRTSFEIMKAADKGLLPDKIIITVHPQRWDDKFSPWLKEAVYQNIKNPIKFLVNRFSNSEGNFS